MQINDRIAYYIYVSFIYVLTTHTLLSFGLTVGAVHIYYATVEANLKNRIILLVKQRCSSEVEIQPSRYKMSH